MAGLKKSAKPNTRQRRYVKGIVDGKSKAQAARDAGYAESVALKAGDKIESKPAVQSAFRELLEKAGITDEKLAKRLNEGLDAKETKFFQHQGLVISKRTVVDHGARKNYLDTVLKLKGHLVEKHEIIGKVTLAELVAASNDTTEQERA